MWPVSAILPILSGSAHGRGRTRRGPRAPAGTPERGRPAAHLHHHGHRRRGPVDSRRAQVLVGPPGRRAPTALVSPRAVARTRVARTAQPDIRSLHGLGHIARGTMATAACACTGREPARRLASPGAATAKPAAATVAPPQMASSAAIGRDRGSSAGRSSPPPTAGPGSSRSGGRATSNRCGALIAADLILTAAHCVYDDGSLMPPGAYVVAGQHLLQPITGEVLRVAKIVPHPASKPSPTAATLRCCSCGRPPGAGDRDGRLAVETAALGSGDGLRRRLGLDLAWQRDAAGELVSSPSYPNELMQTQLDLFTADACNGAFSPTRTFWSAWHLCAGRLPMTTCNGDSGGPHLVQQSNGHGRRSGSRRSGSSSVLGGEHRLLHALRRHHPRRGRAGRSHLERPYHATQAADPKPRDSRSRCCR